MPPIMHNLRAFLASLATPRRAVPLLAIALFVAIGVFAPPSVEAQTLVTKLGGYMSLGVSYLAEAIANFLGNLLLIIVQVLIWVASYNGFVEAGPVLVGWVIVRDIVNMFFILALLLIAFGTILGIDKYSYRNKQLSRLLIMAVVVNFSRTIAGVLIDFAQVVMLTFVNGFANAAGGNFMSAFGIDKIYSAAPNLGDIAEQENTNASVNAMMALLLAVVVLVVSLITVIIMTVVLLWRIAMLWLLVIMSPLAFFFGGLPSSLGGGYYEQWWKEFKGQVMVGPFLAFFLWLSLVSVAAGGQMLGEAPTGTGETFGGAPSEMFRMAELGSFMIAIALMLGGTKMAMSMSQAVGVGKAFTGKLGGYAKGAVKGAANQAYTRTGAKAAMDARRSRSDQERKEREGRRGAAIDVGLSTAAGKIKSGAGYLATGGGRAQAIPQQIRDLRAEELRLRQSRDPEKLKEADELSTKSQALQQRYNAMSTTQRKLDSLKGMTVGAVGGALKEGAERERQAIVGRRDEAIKRERAKVEQMPAEEVNRIAANRSMARNDEEYAAAVMTAMKRGEPGMYQNVEGARAVLAQQGAGAQLLTEFDENTKKHFFTKAVFDEDPAKNEAKKQAYANTKLAINEDTSLEMIHDATPYIAKSKQRQKLEDEITKDKDQTAAYRANLQGAMNDPAHSAKDREEFANAYIATGTRPPSATDAAEQQRLSADPKYRADSAAYARDMLDAFGVVNGAFVGGAAEVAENTRRFTAALRAKGGERMLNQISPEMMFDANGAVTEVGQAMVAAIEKNKNILGNAGRKAEEKGDPQMALVVTAAVQAAKMAGSTELQRHVSNGRAYDAYQGGYQRPTAAPAQPPQPQQPPPQQPPTTP